jgi:hypothetical protein
VDYELNRSGQLLDYVILKGATGPLLSLSLPTGEYVDRVLPSQPQPYKLVTPSEEQGRDPGEPRLW